MVARTDRHERWTTQPLFNDVEWTTVFLAPGPIVTEAHRTPGYRPCMDKVRRRSAKMGRLHIQKICDTHMAWDTSMRHTHCAAEELFLRSLGAHTQEIMTYCTSAPQFRPQCADFFSHGTHPILAS